MKNVFHLLSIAMLCACSAPSEKIDIQTENESLKSTAEAYHEAGEGANAEAMVSFYSPDAKMITPGGEVITGTEDIHKFVKNFMDSKTSKLILALQKPRLHPAEIWDIHWHESCFLSMPIAHG